MRNEDSKHLGNCYGHDKVGGMTKKEDRDVLAEIDKKLKDTPEQRIVVGPLVALLVAAGWSLEQIIFGKAEWRVPKSPSEATKREKRTSFQGFPVDIAVFDDPSRVGDPRHLLFLIECKQPNEIAGVS
jgi:type I restriction enzyme M protein